MLFIVVIEGILEEIKSSVGDNLIVLMVRVKRVFKGSDLIVNKIIKIDFVVNLKRYVIVMCVKMC